MFFFAFTTLLSFSFYAETNVTYLVKGKKKEKFIINVARIVLAGSIFMGAIRSSEFAWNLADVGVGIYTWINLVGLILLSPQAIRVIKDYDRQRRQGKDPVFEPESVGIDNAPVWRDIARRKAEKAEKAG